MIPAHTPVYALYGDTWVPARVVQYHSHTPFYTVELTGGPYKALTREQLRTLEEHAPHLLTS